jgi:proteasome accessory factor A
MAQKYIEQYPVSDELKDSVHKWQYVLDCLDTDPNKLDREIDWVIKRKLIEQYIDSRGTGWSDPRIFMLDLQYHDIRLNRGLYYLLERKGAVERVFTDEEVIKAKTEPPPDTRARMRGEFIKLARQNSIQYDLDWSNIRLGNLLNVRVICNNPFETDTEKVAELVRTIQKTNLRKTSLSKLVIQS